MFEVQNQPPPLEPYNLFTSDVVLREAAVREGASAGSLTALGQVFGAPETIALGFAANKNPPQLKSFDRFGPRVWRQPECAPVNRHQQSAAYVPVRWPWKAKSWPPRVRS